MWNGISQRHVSPWRSQILKRQHRKGWLHVFGWRPSGGGWIYRHSWCWAACGDCGHKPEPHAIYRPDHLLRATIVTNRTASQFDPAGYSCVRYCPPLPDLRDQFILGDHPIMIFDQHFEQQKNLWFQRDQLSLITQLKPVRVKLERTKKIHHAVKHYRKTGGSTGKNQISFKLAEIHGSTVDEWYRVRRQMWARSI
nr:hypothetical protein [Candidatus Halocynthiibacter alkanivorans]